MSTAERLEQLRDLPLVAAADRERYRLWEQEARAELAEMEPPSARIERAYLRAAMRRRGWVVLRGHYAAGDTPLTRDEWRDHWRSLPDYDGPPMRAPSGVRWVRDALTGLLAGEPMRVVTPSGAKNAVQIDIGDEICGVIRVDDVSKAYLAPAEGGRGWCPKLALAEQIERDA